VLCCTDTATCLQVMETKRSILRSFIVFNDAQKMVAYKK